MTASNTSSRPTPRQFLKHMEVPSLPGIFILGSFERSVTLYSQQVRALNLAFSLSQEQRLPDGAEVLVVGGGAAGLTFAAGAARLGARVTLLEQLGDVLSTFRGNHTRWLHPHIYEWPRPGSERKCAALPLMTWSADQAGEVARELRAQWNELREELGIRVFCDVKHIKRVSGVSNDAHEFTWHASELMSGRFSLVIFAVGFGGERQVRGAATPPYWKDDDLHQDMPPPKNRFLVSGIGDGGIVDILRLRIREFQHDAVVRELLSDSSDLEPVKRALLDIEESLDRRQRQPPPGELDQRYRELPVPDSLHQRIRERLRRDTHVLLNSSEYYPLNARASILNRFLLSRLLKVDQLEYRQGRIKNVRPKADGTYAVRFDSGSPNPDSFHRVIIRHGAASTLEHDFSWLWKKASKHLRSINTLDQTREPLWEDNEVFAPKQAAHALANPARTRAPRPPMADPIVGRNEQLREIVEELLAPRPAPVVVLGPPGIGKSTLALAAFGDAAVDAHYGHRRYFARVDAADTRDAIFARIAREMGLTSVTDLSARVLAEFDEVPTLLVLDNADSPWLRNRSETEELLRMLARVPTLALIITMRGKVPPDFGGIRPHPILVEPLTPEESRELFYSIAYDVDRNRPDLDQMIQEMGGVALAVKLLAQQAAGVDLDITLQRWRVERTKMLQSDSDESSSLDAYIALSIKNTPLPEKALRLLAVLALLPAGLSEEDRDSIFPWSASAIARLQKAALIEREGRRWRLLVIIREYVRREHRPREEDSKKLDDFYFSLARQLGPQVGNANGRDAFNQLFEEIDNIEEVILGRLQAGETDVAIDAALQVSDFIRFSGRGSARPLEEACEAARRKGDPAKQARCLLALSRLHMLRRPSYDRARGLLLEALSLFKKEKDPRGEAACLRELGHIATNEYERDGGEGKLEQASSYFHQSLALQERFHDPIGEAYCHHGLARVASFQGKRDEARHLFNKTLQMFHDQEDLLGEAYSLRHLGELEESDDHLRRACELFYEVGELRNLGHGLRARSELARKRGDLLAAEQLCKQALDLFLKLQAFREATWCRVTLAQVVHARSRPAEARALLEQALTSARELHDRKCEEECHRLLAEWGSPHMSP